MDERQALAGAPGGDDGFGPDPALPEPEASAGFGSEVDDLAFALIASAAQARGIAFEALRAVKAGDDEGCDRLLAEAERAAIEAHALQTDLIVREANGEHLPVDVMLVHAQDHLMTSLLARELIEELIELHRTSRDH